MNITIDGQMYDLNLLSEEAKAQIASVQAADIKLNELRRDTAITMTARNSYMQALKKELERFTPVSSSAPTEQGKAEMEAVAETKAKRSKTSTPTA